MKYVVEFGNRDSTYVESLHVPNKKFAIQLAAGMVCVFTKDNSSKGSRAAEWAFPDGAYRLSWVSDTHFVCISKLDGEMRGPGSAQLWPTKNAIKTNVVTAWTKESSDLRMF